tara:strand:+ start:1930 stop:2061 length:132 start_codon:yes stop_codon:yes gene_type:complete
MKCKDCKKEISFVGLCDDCEHEVWKEDIKHMERALNGDWRYKT